MGRVHLEHVPVRRHVLEAALPQDGRQLAVVERRDVEPVPLPLEAQLAPAFGVAVLDLDGAGAEDILLAQNFFASSLEGARLDAGRGLWLRGAGDGSSFTAVHTSESGIAAYGDGRGLAVADYDADGRVDVAIAQNGAPTKLFHNVRASPGVRVRLVGPAANPDGVGAAVRLVYEGGAEGPLREVQAGGGYCSQSESLQVLGGREGAVEVRVRWPDGTRTTEPLEPGAGELTLRHPRVPAADVLDAMDELS